MSELLKQYCTELYLTDEEDGFGRVGNFCVYESADVDAALAQARKEVWEEAAQLIETRFILPGNAKVLAHAMRKQANKVQP